MGQCEVMPTEKVPKGGAGDGVPGVPSRGAVGYQTRGSVGPQVAAEKPAIMVAPRWRGTDWTHSPRVLCEVLTLNPMPPFLQHRQASMRMMTVKIPEKDTATTARDEDQDSSLSGAPSARKQSTKVPSQPQHVTPRSGPAPGRGLKPVA